MKSPLLTKEDIAKLVAGGTMAYPKPGQEAASPVGKSRLPPQDLRTKPKPVTAPQSAAAANYAVLEGLIQQKLQQWIDEIEKDRAEIIAAFDGGKAVAGIQTGYGRALEILYRKRKTP